MKKILIVDDETEFARGVIKSYLEETGKYRVCVEPSGLKALDTAREFSPDLILLDVMMRDAAGPKIARKLASDEELKGVPIIFVTATCVRDESSKGIHDGELGGLPYLAKPVRMEQLVRLLDEKIGGTKAG